MLEFCVNPVINSFTYILPTKNVGSKSDCSSHTKSDDYVFFIGMIALNMVQILTYEEYSFSFIMSCMQFGFLTFSCLSVNWCVNSQHANLTNSSIFHQGGKFDHADRLFQCIEGTYKNCLSNTSDVKELIPEFFYMPEFLINSNSYHLGVKQDGELISDVSLPSWAKVCEFPSRMSRFRHCQASV